VRAASLAAEIREQTGIDAAATSGAKGQFDVVADGALLFSKQQQGRFPEPDEIVAALGRAA
jgi:selT/selW/selH-like putative selenoprotein